MGSGKTLKPLFLRVFFDYNLGQNFQKFDQNCQNPYFSRLISDIWETDFLQKLVVEKDIHFQFQCLYYVYRGLKGFLNVSFWSYLTTNPQKAKSLQMDPQNTFRKHLKPLVL